MYVTTRRFASLYSTFLNHCIVCMKNICFMYRNTRFQVKKYLNIKNNNINNTKNSFVVKKKSKKKKKKKKYRRNFIRIHYKTAG